jgi:hypothetical protein
MAVQEDTCICMIILVNRTTRIIPCYTCLDQSFPVDTAGLAQNNTPDRQDHTRGKQEIQLEQYTNSRKTV